jgi:hypothetical protein
MRVLIFVIFIMMIIIFINELKNITNSFLKMNYIRDISDATIKKYCNDVYCEAETGRFNLAKNSFDLLLPNDVFNTKTYYYMIMLVVIILYLSTFSQFIKYNSIYNTYISDLDGDIFINYMKIFPYILGFIVLLVIIGIIIRRYAPNETSGYKYYFNIDNNDVDRYDSTNINSILKMISFILTVLIVSFIICIYFSNVIDTPEEKSMKANDYYYLVFGYLIFTFIFIYFLINMMNILISFSANKYPKLDNIDFEKNIRSSHAKIKLKIENSNKFQEYDIKNLLASIYTFKRDNYTLGEAKAGTATTTSNQFWTEGHKLKNNGFFGIKYYSFLGEDNKLNSIYDTETKNFGVTVHTNGTDDNNDVSQVHCVIYIDIDIIENKDSARNIDIEGLRLCPNFMVFLVPVLKEDIPKKNSIEGAERYNGAYSAVRANVFTIRDALKQPQSKSQDYEEKYAIEKYTIHNDNTIKYILENFQDFVNGKRVMDSSTPEKTKYINYYNKDIFKSDEEAKRKNHMNVLLNITIRLCENTIDLWRENESKEETKIFKEGAYNTEYFEKTIYPDFLKQTALVKLIDNLVNMKHKYNKKWGELIETYNSKNEVKIYDSIKLAYIAEGNAPPSDTFYKDLKAINSEFIEDYRKYMNEYLAVLTISHEKNKAKFLFPNDYKILRDSLEISDNFSVDLSYDSPNTFYEKYYNIVGSGSGSDGSSGSSGDYLSLEYKLGDYYVKNIKSLLIYVVLLIVLAIFIATVTYFVSNDTRDIIGGLNITNYWHILYNIVIPLCILFIFILYIYFFVCFNTDYNLNIVYGIFDSSYKRSLNSLNNIVIPYIKLHHDTTENLSNNDYYDSYIITNVLASIINGNLELSSYNDNQGSYKDSKNQDPLGLVTSSGATSAIPPVFQSYDDIVSTGKLFKPVSNTETVNAKDFEAYYGKIYEKLLDNSNFKSITVPPADDATKTASVMANVIKEVKTHPLYKFINNINYNPNAMAAPTSETPSLFGINSTPFVIETHSDEDKCKSNTVELIKSIKSKTATASVTEYKNPINKYMYQIISENYEEIYEIILICKKLFTRDNFNNNVFNYNEQIKKGEYGVLKFFQFYNSNEAILPYKFIVKMKKGDFAEFKSKAGIVTDHDMKNLEDFNKDNIQNIVVNFLVTTAHIKYNYELIKAEQTGMVADNIKEDFLTGNIENYNYLHSVNLFHNYKNKKLFSLFANTSYANTGSQSKYTEIDDTFKYTFPTANYEKYRAGICVPFKTQNYTYNMLLNNYELRSLNISNNYLKNVIKTIYNQVNNKEILVNNYGEQSVDGKKFSIYKPESANADPVNTILHKANRCVSVGLMGNYIANIILIAIVYNVGYNM